MTNKHNINVTVSDKLYQDRWKAKYRVCYLNGHTFGRIYSHRGMYVLQGLVYEGGTYNTSIGLHIFNENAVSQDVHDDDNVHTVTTGDDRLPRLTHKKHYQVKAEEEIKYYIHASVNEINAHLRELNSWGITEKELLEVVTNG